MDSVYAQEQARRRAQREIAELERKITALGRDEDKFRREHPSATDAAAWFEKQRAAFQAELAAVRARVTPPDAQRDLLPPFWKQ